MAMRLKKPGEYVMLESTTGLPFRGDIMAYVIVVWVSMSIGFLMGAAWAGLGKRNKLYDRQQDQESWKLSSEYYQGDL
ncbi:MAG: hypothetical protein P8X39_05045 [Desulfofustis sp.]|jgi:hypothetical protein